MELCIDFGGSEIKLGVIEGGEPLATTSLPVTGSAADLARAAEAAAALTGHKRPDTVGIAVPGVVDRERGRLIKAHDKYSHFGERDLRQWARDVFGAPSVLENDARAALVGETRFGVAAGTRDAVLVTLGTGIGTAAMMDGRILRGAHDHAGILGGHVTLDLDGERCGCGNIGCAESIAGAWALRRDLGRRGDSVTDVPDLLAAAAAGDAAAIELRERAIRAWGATVVALCHAYDPDVVILSGGILRAGAVVADPIADYMVAHLWSSSHRPDVVVPDRPELSVLRGLSVLASASDSRRSAERGDQ
jgi:glucokinase